MHEQHVRTGMCVRMAVCALPQVGSDECGYVGTLCPRVYGLRYRLLLSIAVGSAAATMASAVTCGRDNTQLSAFRAAATWGIQAARSTAWQEHSWRAPYAYQRPYVHRTRATVRTPVRPTSSARQPSSAWGTLRPTKHRGTAEREGEARRRSYTRGSKVGDRCRPSLKP